MSGRSVEESVTGLDSAPELRLQAIAGPSIEPIVIEPSKAITVGRSSSCDVQLPDQSVSRQHARLTCRGGRWIISDLKSLHGTMVGGAPLAPEDRAPLAQGDTLAIGPWIFRIQLGADSRASSLETTSDVTSARQRVMAVPEEELGSLAERRLNLLMDCASQIHAAETETELASAALDAVVKGTGFTRAALVRPMRTLDHVELLATQHPANEPADRFVISKTLLAAAAGGQIVRLTETPDIQRAVSVIELGIQSAICAPIMDGAEARAFLYLDARESSARIAPDAAAFCGAIARLIGLAMASLQREQLERRQRQLEADLDAARGAQRRMMPAETGRVGAVAYAMRSRPGRIVAGDLFDVIDLADGRVAFLLGDVVGKGLGAALVMAMAQSHVRAALVAGDDLASTVDAVNLYLATHSGENEFVSMFIGVLDPDAGTLEFVDAGQGYTLLVPAEGDARVIKSEGGLVLGVSHDFRYEVERMDLAPGDRIIVFSDGVVEQPAPDGNQFGVPRVIDAVAPSQSHDADIEAVIDAVVAHAASDELADDVTIASFTIQRSA
jgi:sigma-B regulation protein RsbU (phosphoserine phosphatase)